jgi:hypothetical protein
MALRPIFGRFHEIFGLIAFGILLKAVPRPP